MKKLLLLSAGIIISLSGFTQGRVQQLKSDTKKSSCPGFYLGINGGINNHNGLIGISVEKTLGPQFSIGTGIGTGSWGYKIFAEGRLFFGQNCHRKTAIGLGATRCLGANDLKINLATNYGAQDVILDLKPATNAFVSLYHFWSIGRRENKFYTQVGYSIRIEDGTYTMDAKTTNFFPGISLTQESDAAMRAISPGGFILGIGWYFALQQK